MPHLTISPDHKCNVFSGLRLRWRRPDAISLPSRHLTFQLGLIFRREAHGGPLPRPPSTPRSGPRVRSPGPTLAPEAPHPPDHAARSGSVRAWSGQMGGRPPPHTILPLYL